MGSSILVRLVAIAMVMYPGKGLDTALQNRLSGYVGALHAFKHFSHFFAKVCGPVKS